jgi:RNA polymerase sigma-70 factor (ECF subfamily)
MSIDHEGGAMLEEGRFGPVTRDSARSFEAIAISQLDQSYRLAALILRDADEAEDATHDAFVQAFRNRASLRDLDRFEAWFGRIVVNICRDRLRRRGRQAVVDLSTEFRDQDANVADPVAERLALESAFTHLSAEHRIVIVLRYYLDLTVDQIADRVGIPAGTVKSRLHHAVNELRIELDQTAPEVRR